MAVFCPSISYWPQNNMAYMGKRGCLILENVLFANDY